VVTVKVHSLFGDESEATYTEAEYAQLRERQRKQEEEERRVSDVWEAGLRDHRRRQEEAAREPLCDQIDKFLAPYLKSELAAENASRRISPSMKREFARFQKYCERWDLPSLPAPPQALAVALAEESEHGAARVLRLCRAVSGIHCAVGFPDPAADVLIKAMLRLIRSEKQPNRKT
jgi:hypothetical protein